MSVDPTTDEHRPAYHVDEACALLGITRRTLNRYEREGKIAVVRHGGQAWVTRDALADYWARLHRAADQQRVAAEKRARGGKRSGSGAVA